MELKSSRVTKQFRHHFFWHKSVQKPVICAKVVSVLAIAFLVVFHYLMDLEVTKYFQSRRNYKYKLAKHASIVDCKHISNYYAFQKCRKIRETTAYMRTRRHWCGDQHIVLFITYLRDNFCTCKLCQVEGCEGCPFHGNCQFERGGDKCRAWWQPSHISVVDCAHVSCKELQLWICGEMYNTRGKKSEMVSVCPSSALSQGSICKERTNNLLLQYQRSI